MEALKKSVFSFIMINIVKKGILHFLVNTDAQLEGGGGGGGGGRGGEISPALSRKLEKDSLILGKSVLIAVIYYLNFSFTMNF